MLSVQINVGSEKAKVSSMRNKLEEINSEIGKIGRALNNLASSVDGNTLTSYVGSMSSEIGKISNAASLMASSIAAINPAIDAVYQEELLAVQKEQARLASLRKKEGELNGKNKA